MLNLLLVDDEEKILWMLYKLIAWNELGIHMAGAASNGRTAYEKIINEDIDIVVTDIKMPGMDGLLMIEQVLRIRPDVNFVVISGYNQFEYAQKALRYGVKDFILKPIKKTELNNTLQKICESKSACKYPADIYNVTDHAESIEKRKEFLVYLLNQAYKLPLLCEVNEKHHFSFQDAHFICASVKLNFQLEYLEESIDQKFVLHKVQEIIKSEMAFKVNEVETLVRDDVILVLMEMKEGPSSDEYAFRNLLEKIKVYLQSFDCFEVCMYIGNISPYEMLKENMRAAFSGVKEQLALGNQELITEERIALLQKGLSELRIFHDGDKNNIRHALECCSSTETQENIERILNRITSAGNISSQEIYTGLGNLCSFILELICDEIGERAEILKQYHMAERCVGNAVDREKMILFLSKYLQKMAEEFFLVKSSIRSRPVNRAKEYIEKHIGDALSLNDVAKYVDMSPNYFSRIFKQTTHENFVDYVIRHKMEKAKERLKETEDTMEMVAAAVGYRDKRYFSRQFEKIVGLKPSKYRKLYR